jgi:hypothetical protein
VSSRGEGAEASSGERAHFQEAEHGEVRSSRRAWREGWAGNGGVAEEAGHDAAMRRREMVFDEHHDDMAETRLHIVFCPMLLSGWLCAAGGLVQ